MERQGMCQRSGFTFPASELVREWTGLLVHPRFADKRNPQDFLNARPEPAPPRDVSPEPADVFLSAPVTQDDL
jgi:hypothetical protein